MSQVSRAVNELDTRITRSSVRQYLQAVYEPITRLSKTNVMSRSPRLYMRWRRTKTATF